MTAEGLSLGGLDGRTIDRYLAGRRAAGYREYRSPKALRPLLEYLAPLGVLPVVQDLPVGPVEALLGRFGDYLLSERGLTAARSAVTATVCGRSSPAGCARACWSCPG